MWRWEENHGKILSTGNSPKFQSKFSNPVGTKQIITCVPNLEFPKIPN
ncbi:hypothetical protein LEP1GSC052_1009 [Leptospira kmetyi serovar Malaysia str. Bejo-Iso9]|nr:hypothetical protein LEP1GSC052_1009 [Leptospira kmetyi serovar Malaysia str. Bejo-Iso9]